MEESEQSATFLDDDDFDAFNDQTFGDDGEEYKWEDSQELMSQLENDGMLLGASLLNKEHNDLADVPCNPNELSVGQIEYDDLENENALEESISRLVLDEYDEDEEEERKQKLQRLGKGNNLSTYFMPPQVVSKHLDWIGGGSLLGSSVWAAPAPAQPILPNNTLRNNLEYVDNSSLNSRAHLDEPKNTNAVLNITHKLNNLGSNITAPHAQPSTSSNKPVFKTVEEIERELLEDSSKYNDLSNNTNNNKVEPILSQNKPKIIRAEDLERELFESSQPVSLPSPSENKQQDLLQLIQAQQKHRANLLTRPDEPPGNISHVRVGVPLPPNFPHPNHVGNSNGIQMPPHPSAFTPPHPMMLPNARMHHPMAALRHPGKPGLIHPNAINPKLMRPGGPGMHPRHMMPMPMSPINHQRMHFMQMRPRPPFGIPYPMPPAGGPPGMMGPGPGPMGPMSADPNFRKHILPPYNIRVEDPFSGLMNQKDKQRLKNIQIIQLQNDHPYTTDYYFLMNKVKNGKGFDPRMNRTLLLKLFPMKGDENSRNNYQPTHFENSLGKLQAVSALAPKKAIDNVIRVSDAGVPAHYHGVRPFRYLLREIEHLFECLLKMEEADIRLSIVGTGSDEDVQSRKKCANKVFESLRGEKLLQILSTRKGKFVTCRLIPLLEPAQRNIILKVVLSQVSTWGDVANSDKIYPFLRHCFMTGDTSCFSAILDTCVSCVASLVKCRVGVTILFLALHQVGILLQKETKLDKNSCEALRRSCFHCVVEIVHHEQDLALPFEVYKDVLYFCQGFGVDEFYCKKMESFIDVWIAKNVIMK